MTKENVNQFFTRFLRCFFSSCDVNRLNHVQFIYQNYQISPKLIITRYLDSHTEQKFDYSLWPSIVLKMFYFFFFILQNHSLVLIHDKSTFFSSSLSNLRWEMVGAIERRKKQKANINLIWMQSILFNFAVFDDGSVLTGPKRASYS